MLDPVAHLGVDTERPADNLPASQRHEPAACREQSPGIADLPDRALAAYMIGFAQLHGFITLELRQ